MDLQVAGKYLKIDLHPKKCPICHHAIAPIYNTGVIVKKDKIIDLSFQCTSCNNMFIGKYFKEYSIYYLKSVSPIIPEKVEFEQEIIETSPLFVETYNQSIYAESKSLNQLTGIGLRKSLEFLIKDFLITQEGNDENTIKNSTLSQCIHNFIDDNNLVEISKRATWLGNDETHYVRKWEDKDINDLKILIKLTVNWIHNIILKDKYIEEMNS